MAITGRNVGPDQPAWRDAFVQLQQKARVVFTATIAGQVYACHGTNIETRLTVIDRIPAEDPRAGSRLTRHGRRCLPNSLTGFRSLVPARQPVAAASLPIAPAMFPPRAASSTRPKPPSRATGSQQTPGADAGCRRARL